MLRWRPGVVIPLGLLTIGVGFVLMRWGVSGGGWLTMLPGELIAGIGLGLTNTPVTNTTTGVVSEARAGMASGIDMSARLITLAVNIALMGVILVDGVFSYLSRVMGGDEAGLRRLAEEIAAGHVVGGKCEGECDRGCDGECGGDGGMWRGRRWCMVLRGFCCMGELG
ncbi:hypothetical protein ACQ86N_34430 [Puia sp. P3]|uniref:hypothetical protein n=1 Tax=Puia sp. P3 TaxID=3423952 RepID=UPI003D674F31